MNKFEKKPSQSVNLEKSQNREELIGRINVLSEEWYQLLFNNVSDAVFVHWGPDETSMPGKFIEVNKVACDRLGYTREELLKIKPSDIDAPETITNVPTMMGKLLEDKRKLFGKACMSAKTVRRFLLKYTTDYLISTAETLSYLQSVTLLNVRERKYN